MLISSVSPSQLSFLGLKADKDKGLAWGRLPTGKAWGGVSLPGLAAVVGAPGPRWLCRTNTAPRLACL